VKSACRHVGNADSQLPSPASSGVGKKRRGRVSCGGDPQGNSVDFDVVTSDLHAIYQARSGVPNSESIRLNEDNVRRWTELLGEPRAVLYDRIATYLARGFNNSELPFTFCDAVANDIHGVITSANEDRPELFWKVFLAFDEGEYYHNNNRDEDPVEMYTRPEIARIVASLDHPKS
jgi:hypothetical protein